MGWVERPGNMLRRAKDEYLAAMAEYERHRYEVLGPYQDAIDELINDMYLRQGLSIHTIAKQYGTSNRKTIYDSLHRSGALDDKGRRNDH